MNKIGIIVNPARDPGLFFLRQVTDHLDQMDIRYQVSCCDYETAERYPFRTAEECFRDTELVLTLGGDGTLLHVAPYACRYGVPLLGINLGHLGFLAEMERNEISELPQILNSGYTCTERMMLQVALLRDGYCIKEAIVLNDAVIRSRIGKPAHIVVSDCEQDLLDYFCDGFIVATPTGSTAYSMSAGGPILEPQSQGIVVTPICPHTLGSRSLVLGRAQPMIRIRVTDADRILAYVEGDGAEIAPLIQGDLVCISRHHTPLRLVKLQNKSFYKVLNEKISRRMT